MDRRQTVKAAMAHQKTKRIPYCISFTPDGEQRLRELIGARSAKDFVNNDIIQVNTPWWNWHGLGPEWHRMNAPSTMARVVGNGSYKDFTAETGTHLPFNSEQQCRRW
jgi:hypothetical protein